MAVALASLEWDLVFLAVATGLAQIVAGILYNPCCCATQGHFAELKVVVLICFGAVILHIIDMIVVSVWFAHHHVCNTDC